MNNQWRTMTMDELYDYSYVNQNTFVKPSFPARRWGNVYTKDSTTNIKEINALLDKLKEDGYTVRKRIDKKNNSGTFYRIEIKDNIKL
jgi:MoaA/NifB/PqqE/SkfB family radical SAM enzyme